MRPITRTALVPLSLIAILVLSTTPGALLAQEVETPNATTEAATGDTAPAAEPASRPAADVGSQESVGRTGREYETRNELSSLIRTYQPGLGATLAFHPDLLSDQEFLASYPALGDFLDDHPEVRREPYFYLSYFRYHQSDPVENLLEGLAIFGMFVFIALALSWLIRTWIEQKRWNRLSKNQIEVHNRILDRFGSSEELMEYVRSSAGTRFLEAAPITVSTERSGSPQARIVRTVQIGVVVVAAALGTLLISGRFGEDGSQVLFSLGVIALSVGLGFIGSAVVSNVLSQRLGLWEPARPGASELTGAGDDLVR